MAARRKNLLDAFRAAQAGGGRPPPGQGGPVEPPATPAPAPQRAPKPAPIERANAPLRQRSLPGSRDRVVLLAVIAAVVLVSVAWLLRGSVAKDDALAGQSPGTVQPTDGGETQTEAERAVNGPGESHGGTVHDQALHDKRYKYTVCLIQYKNDDLGRDLAADTYQYLINDGLPAAHPITLGDGKALILCAGYAQTRDDENLELLRKFVAEMRGPRGQGGKQPFKDAYVINIDKVLARD